MFIYNKISKLNFFKLDTAISLPWIIWSLGALFYFYENLLQVSPGVMVQDLMKSLSVNGTSLSNLASFYFYAYALIQIPAGILIDNFKIKIILLSALSFCIFGCLLFATSHEMVQASFGRSLIGIGSGFAAISSMKLAVNWFEPKKFSFLVGLMVTLGMTGSIVGGGPLAVLVEHIGWRSSLLALGFVGLILFALIAFFVKEKSGKIERSNIYQEKIKILSGLKEIIVCKRSWFLAIYAGLMFSPTAIFGGLWGIPFIMEYYNVTKPIAASLVSFLFLGWVIGGPLSGFFAQYIEEKKIMLYGSIGAMLSISIILYVNLHNTAILAFFIFLFGFSSSYFLPSFSLIKTLHKPHNSGVVLGFMNTANTIGGALGLPIVGILLDFLQKDSTVNNIKSYSVSNYQMSLSILPIMLGIAFIIILLMIKKNTSVKKDP